MHADKSCGRWARKAPNVGAAGGGAARGARHINATCNNEVHVCRTEREAHSKSHNPMHCRLQHDKLCTALLSACALSCPCCGAAQLSPVGSSLRCGAGGGSCDWLRRRTSLLTESAARTGTRKRTHRGMARTCACASACGLQAEPRVLVGQRRSVDELSAVNALHLRFVLQRKGRVSGVDETVNVMLEVSPQPSALGPRLSAQL
jgi:hypothetical protein